MAEFNRYTQMPAPLIVNPISFEDFAKVPLMKAKATGEIVGANERISTEYNVDDADLGKISTLVEGIDKVKENIVTDITNNGINSQSVGQVIALKRERDRLYKNKIQQAEENKKLLFAWRQKIDDMVMRGAISPEYGEKIKEKEYGKWVDKGGTFTKDNESDLPRMFQENFGVKYFDIDKDFREQFMEAARQGDVKTTSWGSGKSSVQDVDGLQLLVTPGGGSKTVSSNEKNLNAVMTRLLNEYHDPTTERGQFAEYGDIDLKTLQARAEKYKQEFLDTKNITQVDNTQKQVIGNGSDKTDMNGNDIATENNPIKESKFKISKDLKEATTTNWKEFEVISNKYIDKQKAKSWWKRGIVNPSDVVDLIKELRGIGGSDPKTIKDKILLVYKFPTTIKELLRTGDLTEAMVSNAKKGQIKWINHVVDKIGDYQENNIKQKQQTKVITEDYMRTEWGLDITKAAPEGSAKDIFKGDYNFYRLEDRSMVDGKVGDEEHDEIIKKLATGKAEVQGVIPMLSPDLLDENGNYIKGLSGARKVVINDDNSKYFGKAYYVKLPPNLQKSKNFERIEGLNETILSLGVGDKTNELAYQNNKGEFERVEVVHIDSSPGTYDVITSDGQFTLNDYPELLTRMYPLPNKEE
jgi:hypothetical protein